MKEIFHKITKKNNFGYTLIETMVSVFIFILIVMAGMGALLNASLLHQKSQSMRSIMDNLSYVIEDMSRNMRTGYNFHCFIAGDVIPTSTSPVVNIPKSCTNGWALAFEVSNGVPSNFDDQWVYSIDNAGKILKSTVGPYAASSFIQMTPEEVVINPALSGFSIIGAEPPSTLDTQQPFIIIRVVGKITYKGVDTPFSLQTSVSQRLIDVGI